MKTYRVLESHIYDRLMSIMKKETRPPSVPKQVPVIPEEQPARQSGSGSDDLSTCSCVMHQTGNGIKRTPPEEWVSFDNFIQKKKQRTVQIKKKTRPLKNKKKTKCIKKRQH